MGNIAQIMGQRIRQYRIQLGLSQEKLAEMASCHPTYIGQVERGEKNATIESVGKISSALKVPLSRLFENIDDSHEINYPFLCYELVLSQSVHKQEILYKILTEIDYYDKN